MKKFFLGVIAMLFSFSVFAAVNINTAGKEELQALSGIGPGKAQAIIDYRTKHGSFKSVHDLKSVKGIGEKTIAKLGDGITVSDAAKAAPKKEMKMDAGADKSKVKDDKKK